MKKFLCLILVLLLSVSVFVACGNNEENSKNDNDVVWQNETQRTNEDPKESESTEKTVEKVEIIQDSKNDNSQDLYLILNGTNEESITYHTQNCPRLKDKEIQKASREMIKMLEFRHCSKCNPPKYEGYVE